MVFFMSNALLQAKMGIMQTSQENEGLPLFGLAMIRIFYRHYGSNEAKAAPKTLSKGL
jgi:hypothetical protein